MKIDLHVHTSEMSACGVLSAREVIEGYVAAGYDGIVITNHYNSWTQWWVKDKYGESDYFAAYKRHLLDAQKLGEKLGLRVFFGCELRTDTSNNDYLVYGAPDEVLRRTEELWKMQAWDVKKLADEYGFLFYQAHPFRDHMQITPPRDLFGIEVKNANPRHDSRNDVAEAWAKKYGLHGIAGSDCHQSPDIGCSGIITDVDVKDTADLVEVLRTDNYTII